MLSLFEIRLHATQESLLTSSKAQAFITSSYCSSSYFFPNKMLLFTVPGNTQGCWETYAILRSTLTFPWIGGSSPSTALNSELFQWGLKQTATHTREHGALRMEHDPQHSRPHPGAWYTISEEYKVQLWILQGKKWKRALLVTVN